MDQMNQQPSKLLTYSLEEDRRLRNKLTAIQSKLIAENDLEKFNEYRNKINKQIEYLTDKYKPNALNYASLHILSGSTPVSAFGATNNDFPGEDSVEKFINDLAESYK